MLLSEEKISKIPFHGASKNLIDYFYILGYEDIFIENNILNSNDTFQPIILGSINSSYAKNSFDISILSKIVYPIKPKKSNVQKNIENVIFSFVFDNLNGTSKISFIGYAFKFYEKYSDNVFIPKSFVILSQFPFFTSFKIICEEIYSHYIINKITLPTEIYIYNILNFIPSPLIGYLNIDICYYSKYDIVLKQLSGYPYIDFNLCYLFDLIPINLFIEIFIFSIFEVDILIFSQNIENLNIILYIILALNYPCSDSIYLWYIFSISSEEIFKPTYSKFISNRFCCSLIGITSSYNEKIKINSGFKNYFILDIDNKKIIYKTKIPLNVLKIRDKNGYQLYLLQLFLEKSINKKKEIKESKFLDKYIKKLEKELVTIKEEYDLKIKGVPETFFFINNKISEINIKIQEAFYNFYLNIISIFYKDNSLLSCYDKFYIIEQKSFKRMSNISSMTLYNKKMTKNFFLENNTDKINEYLEEEKIFCGLFQKSTKYVIYFNDFIIRFKSLDLYQISLIFSEDFIYLKLSDLNFKSGFFSIIDSLYSNNFSKSKKFYDITFYSFDEKSKYFLNNFPIKKSNKIEINRKIVNFYINYINNLDENTLISLFPSLEFLNNSFVNNCNILSIINCIEDKMLNYNLINSKQIFGGCLMVLNQLFRNEDCFDDRKNSNFFSEMILITDNLLNYLYENNFPFFRKYLFIILNDFYNMIKKISNEEEKLIHSINLLESYYFIFCNFIRINCIYPNSCIIYELTILLNEFKRIKEEISKKYDLINYEEEEYEEEIDISFKDNINNIFDKTLNTKLVILNLNNIKELKNNIKNESRNCNILLEKNQLKIINNKNEDKLYPKILFSLGEKKKESYIYSLKKLLYSCSSFIDFYKKDSNDEFELSYILMNLLFYGKIINQCPYQNIINLITIKLIDLIKKEE